MVDRSDPRIIVFISSLASNKISVRVSKHGSGVSDFGARSQVGFRQIDPGLGQGCFQVVRDGPVPIAAPRLVVGNGNK